MTVTAEQAKKELRRRQAMAELQRRGKLPEDTEKPLKIDAGGLSEQDREVSTQFSPEQVKRIEYLQKQLGGKMPLKGPIYPLAGPTVGAGPMTGFAATASPEKKRRNAFAELQKMGFDNEQIAAALAYEKGIKPISKTPQTIGSFAAGIAAGQLIPGPIDEAALTTRFLYGAGKAGIAATGGVAGKAIQILADPDAEFNAVELAKVFGEEYIYEGATLGLAPIGKKIIGGAKKTLIPGMERLSRRLTDAGRKIGIRTRLLPAQASENSLIDTIFGIGENSLIGSDVVFQFKKGQLKTAEKIIEGLADEIVEGASKSSIDDVASLVYDIIEEKGIAHSAAARILYKSVDDVTKGATVDLRPVKTLAKEILEKATKAGRIGQTPASLNLLDTLIDDVDDIVSFETGQDIRSGLLDILRRGESKLTPDPKAVGIVKRLAPQVDKAMETAARNISPEAERLRRKAHAFWKEGKVTFHNKMVRKLMRTLPDNPEIVTKSIFRPNATKSILRVRKAAGEKAFQEIKASWIEQLAREAAVVDPSAVAGIGETAGNKMLRKFNGLGQTALNAAFTKKEQEAVRDSARLLGIIQARTGGHSGALRFVQGSALAGIIAYPFVPNETASKSIGVTSGVILFGPAVLGKLMTNPTFAKLLSEGMKAPTGTQQSVALAARLVRNVMQARKEINEARLKREREGREQFLIKQKPTFGHHF